MPIPPPLPSLALPASPTPYPGTRVGLSGGPYPPVSLSSGVSLVALELTLVSNVVGNGVNELGVDVGTSQLKLVASVHVNPELDAGEGRGL